MEVKKKSLKLDNFLFEGLNSEKIDYPQNDNIKIFYPIVHKENELDFTSNNIKKSTLNHIDNSDTTPLNKNSKKIEVTNFVASDSDLKRTQNLAQKYNFSMNTLNSLDFERNDTLSKQQSLISQKTEIKSNGNLLSKNVARFVNKLSTLKKKKPVPLQFLKEAKLNTAEEIYRRFQRSFQIIKVIFRLKMISEDIQTFGTSSNLFDLTTRDRTTVKKVLYPLNEVSEQKNIISDENKLPFPLIHPKSKIKIIWTPIVIILLLYTATLMPYLLVFEDYDDNDWSSNWIIFQLVVDILFWIDLLMNLISAYYNEEGILVKKPMEIFMSYCKGWLFIDLIACLPFNYIGDVFIDQGSNAKDKLHLVRLSRLPRLYRLIKITKIAKVFHFLTNDSFVMKYFEFNSGIMRLITLLFSVSILIHLMGCLWFYEAKLDDFGPDTWVFRNDMQNHSNISLYMASIYFALTTLATVGYGDICAKTNTEMITSIVWMFFGVGFYSFTIGILSSVLAYIDTKATNLQKKVAIMNEFCNEMKISKSLKEKLRKTLEYNTQKNSFTWAEKTNIFNDLPINLRYEIVMNVHDQVISEILFFKNCDDKYFVVRTVPLLKPLHLKSKDFIWAADTNPDAIYFLINGRVNFLGKFEDQKLKNFNNNNTPEVVKKDFIFKSMVAGSYFGEVEILFKRRRDFSVTCEMSSELYYLSRFDFENILAKEFPHIIDQIKIVAKKRDKINRQAMEEVAQLLKTAKETKIDKKSENSLKNSPMIQNSKFYNSDKNEIRKSKSIINALSKFKGNLNRNKVIPEKKTTELIQLSQEKEIKELKSKDVESIDSYNSNLTFLKKEENLREKIEENKENKDQSLSDNDSSSKEDSENNDGNDEKKQASLKNDEKRYEFISEKDSKAETDVELTILRDQIQKNEERQLGLEDKINDLQKTLETTFSLIKELLEE